MRSADASPVVLCEKPTEVFRSLLQSAMEHQGVVATEHGEFYLVTLLEGLLRPSRPLLNQPLGIQYLEALRFSPAPRYRALRRVGDTALVVSGLFPRSLYRSLVRVDYYKSLGQLAYGHLAAVPSSSAPGSDLGQVFAELADRFGRFSAVLSEISLERIFPTEPDVQGMYDCWYYMRRPSDIARMTDRRLIPLAPDDRLRH